MSKSISKNPRLALYAWIVCSFAALFYCYEYLLRIEPSVMIKPLMVHLNVTAGAFGLIVGMYYNAYTPLQAVVGVLTDYFGPKRMLTIAILFCVVGVFIFGYTESKVLAAVGRLMIGAGSAFAFVGVLKLAAMWLPQNRFAMFVGLTTALGMLGAMIGDVGLTWAVKKIGWEKVLLFSTVFGALLIPVFLFYVHDKKSIRSRTEYRSMTFAKAFQGLAQSFMSRPLIFSGIIGCLLYLSLSVFAELWGMAFLNRAVGHGHQLLASSQNSMVFLGWLVGAPFCGFISDKLKTRRWPLMIGGVLSAIMITLLLIWPLMFEPLKYAVLFLFGLFASVEVICFAVARDTMPLKYTATALGVINLVIMLGGMVLQPVVGGLLELTYKGVKQGGVAVYPLTAYQHILMIIPVAMLIASVVAYYLPETYRDKML